MGFHVVGALLFLAISPWASVADPVFHRVDTAGLPHPAVYAVAQDTSGFIWIGTPAGLTRYDGYTFKNYVQSSTPGAPPEVESLVADSRGGLWIGTRSSGLMHFDDATNSFSSWPADPSGRRGPRSASVVAIARIPQGIAIGGDAGLDFFDRSTNSFARVPLVARGSQPRVEAIVVDGHETIWVATLRGLFARASHASSFRRIDAAAAFSLYQDLEGHIWVGALNELAERDSTGKILARYVSSATPTSLAPGEQWAIVEPSPGVIWSGTYDNGLSTVDVASHRVRRIALDREDPGGFTPGQVWQTMRDRSGLVWIANGPGGLFTFNPRSHGIYELHDSTLGGNALQARVVASAPDGKLWLGGPAFVESRDPMTGRTVTYTLPRHLSVQAVHIDGSGALWIGTLQGLCVLLPGQTAVSCPERFQKLGRVLAVTHLGSKLWIGTSSGIVVYDQQTKATSSYRHETRTHSLSNDFVLALFPDRSGYVWAGTSAGLNRIDPQTHQVMRFVHDPRDANSLGAGSVFALAQDHFGQIWAGAVGGSLNVIRQEQPGKYTIRRISPSDGLPSEDIAGLAVDNRGLVWASVVNSLARIDPKTLHVRVFSNADGVAEREFWTTAVAKGSDGTLFFAGISGVTAIDPRAESPWTFEPPVVFTRWTMGKNGRDVYAEYSALDYSAPDELHYRYKLDGYDRDWIDADAQHRSATYTNLPPGNYTLRIRGTNRLGKWSPIEGALTITSVPLWYETWWFRVVLVALLVAAAYSLHLARTVVLRRRQQQLETVVAHRTEELSKANALLAEASMTDPLTGLRNRRFLTEHLESDTAAALRNGSDIIFFMVDIDHFKQINDQLGHRAGDLVLRQMRDRLNEVFRESDFVVRWGGEEFLGVARGSNRAEAGEVAERIRKAIADRPFELDDSQTLRKTASVGFATYPFIKGNPKAVPWLQVVDIADRALYMAKNAGRNTWFGLEASPSTNAADLNDLTTIKRPDSN